VSIHGSVDWLCLPHFSGPSVFGALLDTARGGHFSIAPRGVREARQEYLPDSNVLRTVMRCDGGAVELLDAFAVDCAAERRQRELTPANELMRVARCIEGEVELEAVFQPRPGYACRLPSLVRR